MKKYRSKLLGICFLILFIFGVGININAEYVDNETPAMEQKEEEMIDEDMPVQSPSRTGRSVTLTIPTEGVYDNIIDTKNSAGVMTERKYYYKSKLVEKRTYTSVGSTDCRMENKYLYYSNASTIYIHRTYSNTGSTCYNLQSKRYGTSSQIQAHSIYEGKVNGQVIENRYYDITGVYYTQKAFYRAGTGVLYKRDYWKGSGPNSVTAVANYNAVESNG